MLFLSLCSLLANLFLKMYFFFLAAFVATCAGLAAMAVFLEIFKFWRIKAKQKSRDSLTINRGSEMSGLLSGLRLRGNLER